MDKNLIKAIIASFIVILLFNKFGLLGNKPAPVQNNQPAIQEESIKQNNTLENVPAENKIEQKDFNITETTNFLEKTIDLQTPQTEIVFTNKGGGIKSITFKKLSKTIDFADKKYNPLSVLRAGTTAGIHLKEFDLSRVDSSNTINIRSKTSDNIEVSTFISPSEYDYLLNVKVVIKNQSDQDYFFSDGIEISNGTFQLDAKKRSYSTLSFSRFTIEDKLDNISYKKVKGSQTISDKFHWAGIQNNIYCSLLKESDLLSHFTLIHEGDSKIIKSSVGTDDFSLQSGTEKVFSFNYYLGPKLYFHLKSLNLGFENVIDYGSIIGPITKMLVLFLNFLYGIVKNYGIAIILMTFIFKMATYPLTKKSMVSMKAMQKLQPKLKVIQEQYKNDQATLQKEMMKLYRKHNVNPLSGCFPMLIQLPLFIAFYKAIYNSVELQGASFFFIKDLAQPDALISVKGLTINILPILMGAVQIISSRQTSTDPNQKMMMYFFPVFMLLIFYKMPAALNLYFLVSTVIGIVQNWMIKAPVKES